MVVATAAVNRLMREYRSLQQQKPPHVVVRPDEKSFLIWHFVLHDLARDTPYSGGVYHGKLVFPKEYPFAPPAIYMLTPNGRFRTDKRLCFSMSDYHPESWNPSWRIESILTGFLSFMLDPADPQTHGSLQTSDSHRKRLALQSFASNCADEVFRRLFPEFTNETNFDEKLGYHVDGHRRPDDKGFGATAYSRHRWIWGSALRLFQFTFEYPWQRFKEAISRKVTVLLPADRFPSLALTSLLVLLIATLWYAIYRYGVALTTSLQQLCVRVLSLASLSERT